MRTQASKNSPKKGFSAKSSLKSPTKAAKKKNVSPKKVSQPLKRSLLKVVKKKPNKNVGAKKDGSREGKEDNTSSDNGNVESSSPPSSSSTSQIPSKKVKKDKKKIGSKSIAVGKKDVGKRLEGKKNIKTLLNAVGKTKNKKVSEVKYKINTISAKKCLRPVKNTKIATKKENNAPKMKKSNIISKVKTPQSSPSILTSVSSEIHKSGSDPDLDEDYSQLSEGSGNMTAHSNLIPLETHRADVERTPKFFTSSRTPRSLDIDVKSLKTSKVAIPDKLISPKCKDNQSGESPNLVTQGPDMDVYTFTEKVDSPKNILSDFIEVSTKNVGKVRPIARVKGTVIDKRQETDKKKILPNRPIEEVVKQLKANKKTDDTKSQPQKNIETIVAKKEPVTTIESDLKAIVSKSYKMVARKSSIPGKPFSPIKFLVQNEAKKSSESKNTGSKKNTKLKKTTYESEDELETSKFSLNSNVIGNISSEESAGESNDDNDFKDSSGSEECKVKKSRTKCTKKGLAGGSKKMVSRELRELAKCSGTNSKMNPKDKKMTLLSMWTGPKKHRMASLNAIAKVHCLYENESRTHMELGLMKTVDRQFAGSMPVQKKKEKSIENSSESEYEKKQKSEESSGEESVKNTRTLRGEPGIRSAGKYWDPKFSTSSSEDSELESIKKVSAFEKKKIKIKQAPNKSDTDKPSKKAIQTKGVPVKKKRNRNEVVMDFKDMVVHKRMASLNATAILAASYEKRSPKSSKDETTSDSCSDESFSSSSKNGVGSGVKSESKNEDTQNDSESSRVSDRKQKVEVIVNQDTDVTITGVYSTHHHDGFCTVSGMQYRISSTSHTQTTATANCDKESAGDDEARYTPLSALSSMKPPADKPIPHTGDLGGLSRRPGCSSAFSAPSTTSHHEPGYYQPAGPLIKETAADGADRALARYHPHPPHYHPPHPPVMQQYGPPPYYPSDLCYGQYYRAAGPYHMRPLQPPDAPMVGVRTEPYPPTQYYGAPPCYQHSPQRLPYIEYRGCPCPMNTYPKNVVVGPATGKAPTGGGPGLTHSGLAFRPKARAARVHSTADDHAPGKDPPLESEPPAAADAPRPCPLPLALGGVSPKRELYEVRAATRLAGEQAGPPSPARGSAGACAPQPPPAAAPPRRARLGKDAARRFLVPDDTALLLQPPGTSPDVLALSPPPSAPPIDISSDERSTPLLDIKKENEGPVHPAHRKNDAQALREHNSPTTNDIEVPEKPVKRRYSKPQLHIDMKEVALEDACKTNGIGEHVKLQKRRKISTEQIEISEPKKQVSPKSKKTPKPTEAKTTKRKLLLDAIDDLHQKRLCTDKNDVIDHRPAQADAKEINKKLTIQRPRNKSALLLDNLIRKNSVDSNNISIDKTINPAELFLPKHMSLQAAAKTTLNINNNVIENQSESSSAKPKKSPRKIVSSWYLHDKHRRKSVTNKDSEELGTKVDNDNSPKATAEMLSKITQNGDEAISSLNMSLKKCEKQQKSQKTKLCDIEKVDIDKSTDLKVTNMVESNCIATCLTKDAVKVGQLDQLPRSKLEVKCNGELKLKYAEKISEKAKLFVSKKRHSEEETKEIEAVQVEEEHRPCLIVKPRKGRRYGGGRKARQFACIPPQITDSRVTPRWSNGWRWDGDYYFSTVYLNNDSRLDRTARCWSRMCHASGDNVARGDNVLLRASSARAQPFVARVAKLWENPDDGEMMVSLLWYYRPEHTEQGRTPEDAPDEVFASGHRDANSVACIEDKCYVLTYNEYCRYRKRLKALEEGIFIPPSIVPPLCSGEVSSAIATNDTKLPPTVSPELVLFCRKIYDFRSKKLQVPSK